MTGIVVDVVVRELPGKGMRVGFRGTGTFKLPDEESREIVAQARERYNIENCSEGQLIAEVHARAEPPWEIDYVDWFESNPPETSPTNESRN